MSRLSPNHTILQARILAYQPRVSFRKPFTKPACLVLERLRGFRVKSVEVRGLGLEALGLRAWGFECGRLGLRIQGQIFWVV